MPFSKPLPEWNNPGSEPLQTKKDAGWGIEEHPPADWFNWQWYTTYQALRELQQNALPKDQTATTSAAGIVQLSSATDSIDETKAATPKALKAAYDLANNAIPSTQKGVANGVATLDANGQLVQKPYLTGTFIGTTTGYDDNTNSTTVTLGFRPKAVMVVSSAGVGNFQHGIGGFAIDGFPEATDKLVITDTGFVAKGPCNANGSGTYWVSGSIGTSPGPMRYIAFRGDTV